MIKEELVSVLIPCYNAALYVEAALDSVLSQTYRNLEIILIDDGSTDNTYDKLNKIALTDKRIILVRNEKNLGLIKSLNKGIDMVTGLYIERFDADDLISSNRIENQILVLTTHPEISLLTSYATYITPSGKFHSRSSSFYCTRTLSAKFLTLFETPLLHAGMLIKTELLKELRYDETEGSKHIEDYDLFTRILFRDLHIYVDASRKGMYFYRRNSLSVSGRNKLLQFENAVHKSELNIKELLHYNIPVELLRVIKLNEPDKWHSMVLLRSIKELKYIKLLYCNNQKNKLKIKDFRQINIWVAQRRLRMIAMALIKGTFTTRLAAIFIFILNIDMLFYAETYKSIFDKTVWFFNSLKYKN
ncbi:MAG: glycosyltransferase family 2 protein [Bacteroidia bacterium]|nr:glycosyltransferase family 2 protein [Bacteroidia bacterium]